MKSHRHSSETRRDAWLPMLGLVALVGLAAGAIVAFGGWFAETDVREEPRAVEQGPLAAAAQPERAVDERVSDEKRRELTDDQFFTGDSRRIEVGPQFAGALRAGAIWTVAVRAEDERGEPLEFESGSVSFLFVGPGSLTHVLRCDVERGLWTSALPIGAQELVWFQFSSARLDGRRFVPSDRYDPFDPHFDGSDVLVLEPAPRTLVSVIDPRTSKLAREAELLISTKDDAQLGYRFTFTAPFRGEPIRIDELRARDLEEVREVEVRASIVGVGEVTATLALGSGQHYELRPLNTGSARITWFPPEGFSARKPELVVRPERLKIGVPSGHWEATRIQRLGASWFEGRDRDPTQELDDQPCTELVEGLPDGEYLAEITAELHVSSGRRTIGSTRFSVESGTLAEVEIHTEPRAEDDWRLLAVELELPPELDGRDVAASVVPVGFGARSFFNYIPVAAGRKRFVTALVLRGRHEFALAQPLPFATTIDVERTPVHVERVVVPAPLEYRIRFRHDASGEDIALHGGNIWWRARGSTAVGAKEWPAIEDPKLAGGPTRILAPEAIELRLHPSGAWALAEGEWVPLADGGDQSVSVRLKPAIMVRVSTRDDLHNLSALVHPWVRQVQQGTWMELSGYWSSWDADPLQEFEGWLPFEGEFELDLRCDEDVLPLQRRRGTLQFDQRATFEFELVRAQ